MLRRLLYKFSGRLPCRLINTEGKRYLERYYLGRLFGFTFYLHRFVNGDGDRALHDHPWKMAGALCLAGGYKEKRIRWFNPETVFDADTRQVKPGRINLIGASTFHQILKAEPDTWTLFAHSKKVKEWGFLSRRDYVSDTGALETQPYYYRDRDPESHQKWWVSAPRGQSADRAPQRI